MNRKLYIELTGAVMIGDLRKDPHTPKWAHKSNPRDIVHSIRRLQP